MQLLLLLRRLPLLSLKSDRVRKLLIPSRKVCRCSTYIHSVDLIVLVGEETIVDDDKVDLATWPVTSEEAREALETMAADEDHNWEVVPIPAFDIKGNQIAPEDYEAKLKGCVALITVNICHQYFRARQEDSYYADIEEIVVLKEPYVMASTPKRKHGDKVDTPSKKVRKDND